jgi:NADPH2:quinone reductase
MLVGFGNASGVPAPFDPMVLAKKGSLFYTRASLFDYVVTRAELLESASKVFGVMGRGAVKVHVGQTFALDEARACHEALESRGTRGATVLTP